MRGACIAIVSLEPVSAAGATVQTSGILCCFCGSKTEAQKRTTVSLDSIADLVIRLSSASVVEKGANHFGISQVIQIIY